MQPKALSLILVLLALSDTAQANLIDRGNGLIFDQDLNITWLADANYAQTSGYDVDGKMNWSEANNWANNLTYGGYSDWRLPSTPPEDIVSSGFNKTSSEWGIYFTASWVGQRAVLSLLHTMPTTTYSVIFNLICTGLALHLAGLMRGDST